MPSGSTRLTVAFLYSFPLIVLMSSASASDTDSAARIAMVVFRGFMCVDSVFLLSTPQRQSDLQDQTHREFVNRPFQFNERSQLFIRAHNETLGAIVAIMVSIVRSIGGYKPPFPIPERPSAFPPRAQQNAFRRRD